MHAQVLGVVHRKLKARGFEALFVALDANPDIPTFVRKYNVPFAVGTGDGQKARDFFEFSIMQRAGVPWLAIIDRKGVIRHQYTGENAIFDQGDPAFIRLIEPLLNEAGAPPAAKKSPGKK